jgi:hypothetical protein
MKQEIWRFDECGLLRLHRDGATPVEWVASAYNELWCVFGSPAIGGVRLMQCYGGSASIEGSKQRIVDCIKEQLAAHNVKVEIRRVKR